MLSLTKHEGRPRMMPVSGSQLSVRCAPRRRLAVGRAIRHASHLGDARRPDLPLLFARRWRGDAGVTPCVDRGNGGSIMSRIAGIALLALAQLAALPQAAQALLAEDATNRFQPRAEELFKDLNAARPSHQAALAALDEAKAAAAACDRAAYDAAARKFNDWAKKLDGLQARTQSLQGAMPSVAEVEADAAKKTASLTDEIDKLYDDIKDLGKIAAKYPRGEMPSAVRNDLFDKEWKFQGGIIDREAERRKIPGQVQAYKTLRARVDGAVGTMADRQGQLQNARVNWPDFPDDCGTEEARDDGSHVSIGGGFTGGTLDRRRRGFLRTEDLGIVVLAHMLQFDADATFRQFQADFSIGMPAFTPEQAVARVLLTPWQRFFTTLAFIGGYSNLYSKAQDDIGHASAGGRQTAVLSPLANGPLGGGAVTAPGFGDVQNASFALEYRRQSGFLGLSSSFDVDLPNGTKAEVEPRVQVNLADSSMYEIVTGVTNAGTFPFAYRNMLDTSSVGVGLGVDLRLPFNLEKVPGLGFYATGDVSVDRQSIDGFSQLNAGNFAPERKELKARQVTVAGEARVGLYLDLDAVDVEIGVGYRAQNEPNVSITGNQDATVEFDTVTSVRFFLMNRIRF